jgi:ATP-dependent DNA ligase
MFLFAFDLLEINGQDLRREPLEMRKRKLGSCYVGLPKLACNSTNISLSPATSSSATL